MAWSFCSSTASLSTSIENHVEQKLRRSSFENFLRLFEFGGPTTTGGSPHRCSYRERRSSSRSSLSISTSWTDLGWYHLAIASFSRLYEATFAIKSIAGSSHSYRVKFINFDIWFFFSISLNMLFTADSLEGPLVNVVFVIKLRLNAKRSWVLPKCRDVSSGIVPRVIMILWLTAAVPYGKPAY